MNLNHRYIAKITIETVTPLSIGSGEKGLLIDRIVAKDANGLPYIPGTSLSGVLLHSFALKEEYDLVKSIFGSSGENGEGSRLKMSAAHLVGEDGITVIEGLKNIDFSKGFYQYFNLLPERDHVRINHKGTADSENHGKYDEQLVHKGTRFVFEMELIGTSNDIENWNKLINLLASPLFRIGAGTRKGFGELKIIQDKSYAKIFNLSLKNDLLYYLNKSSSLNFDCRKWSIIPIKYLDKNDSWINYSLKLEAKDFFMFGAGFGDDDADNKSKTEKYFDWSSGKPNLISHEYLLIPATSIKGAIAHRVAYLFNKEECITVENSSNNHLSTSIDSDMVLSKFDINDDILNIPSNSDKWESLIEEVKSWSIDSSLLWSRFKDELDEEANLLKHTLNNALGENNEAVKVLFGFAKNDNNKSAGQIGKVIINDIYLPYQSDKVFNHTKIYRFTNGTIDGALFQEKVVSYKDEIILDIWVEKDAFNNKKIQTAFEKTLEDLIDGRLPLGGNTTKGYGIFKGSLIKK